MKLHITKIRYKNFLSTGNEWQEIYLGFAKTTLIVGKNGSGKSTLLDALSFALFNKPFRSINKPQLVNTITGKECVVEISFALNGYEWKVIRGIKPNVFEIWKDDELLTVAADVRDYQDAFERHILRASHKTFCQVVVLGSAIFTPFMALPTPRRREIIEDLLDLEIFSKMNVLLKDKIDNVDRDIRDKESDKKLVEERINLTEQHQHEMGEAHDRTILDIEQQIDGFLTRLSEIVTDGQEIKKQIKEIEGENSKEKHEKTKEKIVQLQAQVKQQSKQLNKEILFFANNTVCPTCKQDIDDGFKTRAIKERQDASVEIEQALGECDRRLEDCNRRLEEIQSLEQRRRLLETRFNEKRVEGKHIEAQIKDQQRRLKDLKEKTFEEDFQKLEQLKKDLEEVQHILIEMADDRTVMGYAAQMLKDSGIKGKIIKTFIPVINQLINKYLASLDFFVEFQLDEQFSETILSRFRDSFSYASFSEGEKMRLNLALLFAWRAIARLRSSLNCNILIFDELLDSALDNEGIDDVLRLIGGLTADDNVVIISHREDQISDRFDKIIRFDKIKNFSRMVDA